MPDKARGHWCGSIPTKIKYKTSKLFQHSNYILKKCHGGLDKLLKH